SGLYHLHDLLRDLARPDDAARARHAHTALALASEANAAYKQGRVQEALARFDVLWPHLQAAWAWMRTRDDPAAQQWLRDFGWDFIYLLDLRTTPAERIPYLQAARALGDKRAEGALLGALGLAYAALGRVEDAIEHYRQALAIAREIGDRRGEGNRLGNLGNAYADLGRVEEAIEHYQQALAIAREIGDRRNEGAWLGALGLAYAALGRVEEAIEHYQQALAIAREIGDKRNEGIHAWNLGLAYEKLGDCARAAEWMQILVDYERAIGHPDAEKHAQHLAQVRARTEQGDC
ncbi:MAG: tetratricopeptide repeat protein, partial [Chloroflexi bacterium]|nr:tetratricopeptide repeat protein [Chloroflexota bacterium]